MLYVLNTTGNIFVLSITLGRLPLFVNDQVILDFMENTPPPEDFQKWCDELYADLPDLSDTAEESLASKYDLRIEVREKNHVPTTYLDQDDSGTFDPAYKKPPECIPTTRKKRERRERIDDVIPKRIKTNTWQGGRWAGRELPLVLKFTSEHARAALKAFGPSLDHWPQRLLDLEGNSPIDWPKSQVQPYGLRERTRCGISDFANAVGDDDLRLEDIMLGYPAYRGCKTCFEWGFRCPLLDEGSKYPCAECAADNTECELIVEPAVKRTCEGCRSRRQQCSYKEKGGDHTEPCQQCANASRKCVAGPASGRTRTGPSLDQVNPQKQHSKSGIPKANCAQCLTVKPRCLHKNHRKQPECSHRYNEGTTRKVGSLEPQAITSYKGKEKEHEICTHKRTKPAAVESTRFTRCLTITTKLAHPIQFNYAYDDDEGIAPCHWCEDAIYGILGLGEVKVEVVDNRDGQGFTETANGHTEMYGHSRMCEFCTTDRLKITACKNHDMQLIQGMDPEKFDYGSVMEWMMPGMASLAPFAWCSICPSPAFFCCSTKSDIEMDGQAEDLYLGDQKGCGLLLCESCATSLVNEHEGKLDKLMDSLENDGGDGGFQIRADANFLHSDGELLRRMGAF